MAKKTRYEIRVHRVYETDFIDLEIKAGSRREAKKKAKALVLKEADVWFGPQPNPSYEASDPEED